ncbi:MAG: molybdenum cofactor biosynthesis protein MoaE, partial [Akkermansiaceae bacterium]|nr:molybdenum cofactor biosynthesis protein MoaE [Akkermansiaceae bacterium]
MFRLTSEPLDLAALRRAVSDPHAGAVAVFEGTVRNHHRGRDVLRLEYEAHPAVAEKEGNRIVSEAVKRFGLDHAEAVHRIGELAIEESAV